VAVVVDIGSAAFAPAAELALVKFPAPPRPEGMYEDVWGELVEGGVEVVEGWDSRS